MRIFHNIQCISLLKRGGSGFGVYNYNEKDIEKIYEYFIRADKERFKYVYKLNNSIR